ncbi:hypothetical protein O6H91_20G039800 [Diphasiastrum complanatum]|nr:hypothetical protein O6H91_20G039800 [Diphasiastrum complanatum]
MEPTTFRPSIAVIIGVLTTMCSLTFLLLIYAKHCKTSTAGLFRADEVTQASQALQIANGIDQVVIQALPTFVFSALKGNKDGLECAVCLSKYDDCEVLRLLPKCKHAFHVDCVDTWLLAHSTCPLCRCCVSAEDLLLVDEIIAARKSLDGASVEPVQPARNSTEACAFQFYVQQESNGEAASSTMLFKSTLPPSDKMPSDQSVSIASLKSRRLGHRIIISDVVLQHRWSDLVPSDVLFLNSQTLFCPSERISISDAKARLSIPTATPVDDYSGLKDIEAGQESFRRSTSKPAHPLRLSRSKHESGEGRSAVADGSAISFLRRACSLSRTDTTRGFLLSPSMRSMSEMTGFNRFASSRKKDLLVTGTDSEAYQLRDVEKSRKWLSIAKKTLARLMRK